MAIFTRALGRGKITWLTVIGLVLVPVIIAGSFVFAIYHAGDRFSEVKAAVVNKDDGAVINGQKVPMGRQLAAGLVDREDSNYNWVLTDANDAAEGLAHGEYVTAVTIPEGFSEAIASMTKKDPEDVQQATVQVTSSKVTPLADAVIGQAIAEVARSTFNEEFTEKLLSNIYVSFNTIGEKFMTLADAADELAAGAGDLAHGAEKLDKGTTQLSTGAHKLAAGGEQLSDNGQKVASGVEDLSDGAEELAGGVGRLAHGLDTLSEKTDQLPEKTRSLSDGADTVASGAEKLSGGVKEYTHGVEQLVERLSSFSLPSSGSGGSHDGGQGELKEQLQSLVAGARHMDAGISGVHTGLEKYQETLRDKAGKVSHVSGDLDAAVAAGLMTRAEAAQVRQQICAPVMGGAGAGIPGVVPGGKPTTPHSQPTPTGAAAGSSHPSASPAVSPSVMPGKTPSVSPTASPTPRSMETAQPDRAVARAGGSLVPQAHNTAATDQLTTPEPSGVPTPQPTASPGTGSGVTGVSGVLSPEQQCAMLERTFVAGLTTGSAEALKQSAAGLSAPEPKTGTSLLGSLNTLDASATTFAHGSEKLTTRLSEMLGSLEKAFEGLQEKTQPLLSAGKQLRQGSGRLANGADELASGTEQLAAGMGQLSSGINRTAEAGDSLENGASQLAAGTDELAAGMNKYVSGVGQYTKGVSRLAGSTQQLSDGARELSTGADSLAEGMEKFAEGVEKGAKELPNYSEQERHSLAEAVTTPVSAQKFDFGSFSTISSVVLLIVMSLWIGALLVYTVTRAIPREAVTSQASSFKLLLTSLMPGVIVSVVQAIIVTVISQIALDMSWKDSMFFGVLTIVVGIVFTVVNYALVALGGGIGRFISVAVVAAAVAGNTLSATPGVLTGIQPVLPLTPAIHALTFSGVGVDGVGTTIAVLIAWLLLGFGGALIGVARSRKLLTPQLS